MVILFFKALREAASDYEPVIDKMRRILEAHLEAAETDEDRDRASKRLPQFGEAKTAPNASDG